MLHILVSVLVAFSTLAEEIFDPKEMVSTEVLILEATSSKRTKGGGSSSIGADSYDLKMQTGWFYGDRAVTTCYNSLKSFGVKEGELEKILKKSIKTWQDYFAAKVMVVKGNATTQTPNLNFDFKGKCKGDEDLVFFFGAGPIFGNMQDLKTAQTLQNPLAYANKTQMRRDMEWSKGYVRVISHGEYEGGDKPYPDWMKPKALEAVLLHEIGHILGFVHTPNTIMSANVMEQLFDGKKPVDLSVDQGRQLITCENCKEVYTLDAKTSKAEVLKQLGLDLKQSIRLEKEGAKLVLTDGKVRLDVAEPKFTRVEKTQTLYGNFSSTFNSQSETANIYGSLKSADGAKKIPVILEYNSIDHRGGLGLRALNSDNLDEMSFVR